MRCGCFTLLKFKGNLRKIIAKNLVNMIAFNKTKYISPVDAFNWQGYIISLTKCDVDDCCNLSCLLASSSLYVLQCKLWVTSYILGLVIKGSCIS
jgi:hypothetical protein